MVVALAGMLELNFDEVCVVSIPRYVGKPVVSIQLAVLTSYGLMA